jgi:hypothetical protein
VYFPLFIDESYEENSPLEGGRGVYYLSLTTLYILQFFLNFIENQVKDGAHQNNREHPPAPLKGGIPQVSN